MWAYIARRLLLSGVSVFLVILIVFFSVRLMPGDIVDQFFQDAGASQEDREALRDELGLNDPVYVQFGRYVSEVVRGDFGNSLWTGENISTMVQKRMPITIELGVLSLLYGTIIGIPLGVFSAVKQSSFLDYLLRSIAILGISIPYFWIAILTIALPAYYWHWAPPVGHVPFFSDPIENLKHYTLPAIVLSIFLAGTTMRMLRATLLEVLRLDFMRTAAAKGLARPVQLRRHALRNALIPVVTLIGLRFIFLLSGSAVIETVYGLPGMGQLMLDSISRRDYQVVQAVTLLLSFVIIGVNLLVDLSYGLIDPRIRVS
ncbi:MAG: ABC transporter permease [Tepidiformaceae bacterium]